MPKIIADFDIKIVRTFKINSSEIKINSSVIPFFISHGSDATLFQN